MGVAKAIMPVSTRGRRSALHQQPMLTSAQMPTKVAEAIRMIERDGWYQVKSKGSHRQFKHATKSGRVTIAGKPSDDLAPKTFESILKQAGLWK